MKGSFPGYDTLTAEMLREQRERPMTIPNATDSDSPGRTAYEAYSTAVDGKSISGDAIPAWDDNDNQKVKDAWEAAAVAVIHRWRDDESI